MRFGRIHDKGLKKRKITSGGHGCLVHEYHQLVERPRKPLGVQNLLEGVNLNFVQPMETMEDFLIACQNFLLFCMDGPSRDSDHLKGFIEPLFLFSLCTQTLDSMFLDFEYLSLLFISAIFLHCGQKPRIPWRFKCLLHCGFPFICTKSKLLCFGTFHLKWLN